jgi:hypothetical protein
MGFPKSELTVILEMAEDWDFDWGWGSSGRDVSLDLM